jgi:hypothetical protein
LEGRHGKDSGAVKVARTDWQSAEPVLASPQIGNLEAAASVPAEENIVMNGASTNGLVLEEENLANATNMQAEPGQEANVDNSALAYETGKMPAYVPADFASKSAANLQLQSASPDLTSGLQMEKFTAATNSARQSAANKATPAESILPKAKPSKWSVQYYATPSLSYRYIKEEKNIDPHLLSTNSVPAYYLSKVNSLVNQTPKLGLEAGAAFRYKVTDQFLVKMGLQGNFRQYGIDAYNQRPTDAIIRMSQGTDHFDTLTFSSSFGNFAGDEPANLTNYYVQLAVPLGFELALTKNSKSQFVVGSTIQPTYIAAHQAWLLSADYQNYVKAGSEMINRFNLNLGAEFLFRFAGKGGINWQVGPQIRYQLLPSVNAKYPIHENLIDYGVKFGISKSF